MLQSMDMEVTVVAQMAVLNSCCEVIRRVYVSFYSVIHCIIHHCCVIVPKLQSWLIDELLALAGCEIGFMSRCEVACLFCGRILFQNCS